MLDFWRFWALLLIVISTVYAGDAIYKRQTYHYPDNLKIYARPHPDTKIYQGTLSRYAPHEWPKWYTRNLFRWDGLTRLSPYDQNDARYEGYRRSRISRFY